MADLVACGPKPTQQWRQTLPTGQVVRLGRTPKDMHGWAVPWDYLISREHADLQWANGELLVRCLAAARNPIYFQERPAAEFTVGVGQEFRIGTTRFLLEETQTEPEDEDASGIEERAFSVRELRQVVFGNEGNRLDVLCRLPNLIAQSRTDEEFAVHLTDLLLAAIPKSDAVAVIACDDPESTAPGPPALLRWNSRQTDLSGFRPSQGLVRAAVIRDESVVHVWSDLPGVEPQYTVSNRFEWAYCTPIPGRTGRVWCLYVSGQRGMLNARGDGPFTADDLKGDVRFTQLLAQFIGAIRKVRRLESQQVGLAQFFSPAVMESLIDAQADVILAPRESEITVLFCDLRGFSRAAERARQDLRTLLDRVSAALGVMTRSILRYDGVVADFQGDAALGFWGWPVRIPDGPLLAARAALLIQSEFDQAQRQPRSPLHNFRVGIGIAHGQAIAGKIGGDQQAKVGAFGPVVRLGSRLESLTKPLRASILMDDVTTEHLRQHLPPSEGRVRRLGRIRPTGGGEVLSVGELLPPAGNGSLLSDQDLATFESAVAAVSAGQWDEALQYLEHLPAADRTKDFLMISIALNDYRPPDHWDGVVELPGK